METVKDKIERLKFKEKIFRKNNTKTFIIDIDDNYYFCNILLVDEDYLHVKHFTGKKKGEKESAFGYLQIPYDDASWKLGPLLWTVVKSKVPKNIQDQQEAFSHVMMSMLAPGSGNEKSRHPGRDF